MRFSSILVGVLFFSALLLMTLPADGISFEYPLIWADGSVGASQTQPYFGFPKDYIEWYFTEGNNMQAVLSTYGLHEVWAEQKSILWPRGSGEKYLQYGGLWYGAVGDFSLDEKPDTAYRGHGGSDHQPGRMPTNFWWREDGLYWQACQDLDGDGEMDLPIGYVKLKVSTRDGDLDAWPPEFRTDVDGDGKGDINGEPIVLGDEDVICFHHSIRHGKVPIENLDRDIYFEGIGPNMPIQFEERIFSLGHPVAGDILFHQVTIRNMSRWNFYARNDDPSLGPVTPLEDPYLPPTDFNSMMVGMQGETYLGSNTGYVPALRLLFTFDRNFKGAGYRDQKGFLGIMVLHTPEVNGEEIPITVATGNAPQGNVPWKFWDSSRLPAAVGWDMIRGELNVKESQDPGPNPGNVADPRADSTVYLSKVRSSSQLVIMAQSDDLVVPPDSAVQFDYAWLCAYPVNNPVPDNSDEGVIQETKNLLQVAKIASQLYDTAYRLPKAPPAPNFKLIPGNGQVTITWDDLAIKTPDPFLPEDDPSQGFRRWDFEGFRVYRSLTGKLADTELLAQYDLRNGITLETGIVNRVYSGINITSGTEADFETSGVQDTLGASPFDRQKRWGLGQDTGIKFAYVDQWDDKEIFQRLTNGFRYFYEVTAYDWNQGESLESSIAYTEANMVVPRSDANTYRIAEIELSKMYDGAGNELDPLARAVVPVELGRVLGSAVPTNAFVNGEVVIHNAELIGAEQEYRIRIDSIVGGPEVKENHLSDPLFDPNVWQSVYVSLLDGSGRVVGSDFDQMAIDVDPFAENMNQTDAHLRLSPEPDSGRGVPFSVEFDLRGFDFDYMHINEVEVLQGQTDPEDITVRLGYSNAANNIPAGFRAADFEITFVDYGSDSASIEVRDLTHNAEVPFRAYPGAGWCFFNSWSRMVFMMKNSFRHELTYDDVYGGGPKLSWTIPRYSKADFPLSSDAKVRIHLCGMQIVISSKYPPVPGDKLLVRSSFGTLPDSVGDLSPMSPRPPVSGVSYGVLVSPAEDRAENLQMKRIRVVPNPYIITTPWDQSTLSKQLQFVNLPNRCRIKIYTLSGHLVQILDHDGGSNAYSREWKGGTTNWNLQNRFNALIASGWYIWHATDLDTGKKEMGKFAVIQ